MIFVNELNLTFFKILQQNEDHICTQKKPGRGVYVIAAASRFFPLFTLTLGHELLRALDVFFEALLIPDGIEPFPAVRCGHPVIH